MASIYHNRRDAEKQSVAEISRAAVLHARIRAMWQAMAYDIDYSRGIAWQQPVLRIPRSPAPRPGVILLHGSEGAFAGWALVCARAAAARL
jgi:hypothetical protein